MPRAAHAPMEVSRDGQPSAPGWLRIRAYSSPLARSAFGRVLSPPYAAVWPAAPLSGGAWSSRVTPGQRRTPYAWSSGLLRYPACPRTYGLASSAGGKGSLQAVASCCHTRLAAPPSAPHPSRCSSTAISARTYSVTAPRYSVLVRFTPLSAGRYPCDGITRNPSESVLRPQKRSYSVLVRSTPSFGCRHADEWSMGSSKAKIAPSSDRILRSTPSYSLIGRACSTARGRACCCHAIRGCPWRRAP